MTAVCLKTPSCDWSRLVTYKYSTSHFCKCSTVKNFRWPFTARNLVACLRLCIKVLVITSERATDNHEWGKGIYSVRSKVTAREIGATKVQKGELSSCRSLLMYLRFAPIILSWDSEEGRWSNTGRPKCTILNNKLQIPNNKTIQSAHLLFFNYR